MGREIRRVTPDWQHPTTPCKHWGGGCGEAQRNGNGLCFLPMYDEDFESAKKKHDDARQTWAAGGKPAADFEDWHGSSPDPAYYRPKWTEAEATWFQMYETVSEGTPVSPAFATAAELIDYLVVNGDFWDQSRDKGGWSRESAERFVTAGWAPSMMISGGVIKMPRDL